MCHQTTPCAAQFTNCAPETAITTSTECQQCGKYLGIRWHQDFKRENDVNAKLDNYEGRQMPNCWPGIFNPVVGATGVPRAPDPARGDPEGAPALCRILCAPGSYNTATGCIA